MEQIKSALAEEKLAKAKSSIILGDPFFATLMFRLRFSQDDSCETMWTNGIKVGYNPTFIENLSIDQVKGCIVHEIMHCIGKHPMRRGDRDHMTWNLACDYAINPLLVETGKYALPSGVAIDIRFDNKAAEEVYTTLASEAKEQEGEGDPDDQACNGGQGGSGDSNQGSPCPDDQDSNQPDPNQQDPDQQDPEEQDSDGQDPNGQNDNEQDPPENDKPQDPGGCGEVRDYPPEGDPKNTDNKTSQEAANEWDIATIQAAEAAKTCGQQLGGQLQKIVDDIKDPKQNWKEVLARFMEEVSYNDYDWEVVDARHLQKDIVLPSLHSKTFGDITIAVDVSGSISSDQIVDMLGEIFGILQTFDETGKTDAKIPIVYCSSYVHDYEMLGLDDTPNPVGTGGTAFSPAIKFVNDNFQETKALIYLTDGFCDDFGPQPDYDVMWGICFNGIDRFEPPFGEVLYLEDK